MIIYDPRSFGQSSTATTGFDYDTWLTDWRPDVARIAELGVPMLLIHGTADLNTPIDATGGRLLDFCSKE